MLVGFGLTFLFFIFFLVFMVTISVLSLVFWVFMLIDVLQRKNWQNDDQKLIWILVVILVGAIGALIYYFEIYKKLGKAN